MVVEVEVEFEYKELIDLLAEKDLDLDIPNSSPNHAKYVIKKILEKTKKEVNIFSNKLDKKVFLDSSILDTFNDSPYIKINILLENPNLKEVNQFKKLLRCKHILIKSKKINKGGAYFIVSDGKRVRLESKEDFNKARVNFNKPHLAKSLNILFDEMWNSNCNQL